MEWLKRIGLAATAIVLVSCAREVTEPPVDGADITAIAIELGSGTWQVTYHLDAPQSALFFSRSNGDYRTATWRPLDGAPPVQRIGGFDSLIFDTPTTQFAYEITPYSQGIPRDYTPFLAFSDGGTAMFTGQFELLPAADEAEIEALAGNLMAWTGEQPQLGVRVRSDRPMLVQGTSVEGMVEHVSNGGGTYVYVGEAELQRGQSYIGVIDGALPEHLRTSLDEDLSALFAIYEEKWGFALPTRSTIYYAFGGFDHPGFSNKGSVLGTDLMVLQSSGEGLREPNPENRVRNLWFFAHEGAHMFQSHVMQQFSVGPDAWIHEGGANAMANSAIQSLPGVPDSFIIGEYRTAFENCVTDLERGDLTTAHVDGRFYAHYHCGQLFNAAADAALPDHDLYAFWIAFTAKSEPDGTGPAEAFYATLDELGADPRVAASIRALATTPSEDPRAALSDLLSTSGLNPEFDDMGALVSLELPN